MLGYFVVGYVKLEQPRISITMIDACVLRKCSRNLVLVWAKNLPDSAVQHIVDQVDLPPKHQQLFRLRLLVCQHKG